MTPTARQERERQAQRRFLYSRITLEGEGTQHVVIDTELRERVIGRFGLRADAELFLHAVRNQYINEPGVRT